MNGERVRDQRRPEQRRFDMRERQHAGDRAGALGQQVMRAVAKGAVDHLPPRRQMKEGAAGAGADKIVPSPGVPGAERPYRDRER